MRFGFFLPWWMLPFAALVWVCFLPVWIVLAVIRAVEQRRERQRNMVRVTVSVRDHAETPPPTHYG